MLLAGLLHHTRATVPQGAPVVEHVVTALFFGVAVFLVALLAGMAGALPVFVLGLFVPGYTVLPLTFFLAGLFSALGGAWMANVLHPDRSTSDLLPIVGFTELAAALLALAMFVLTFGLMVVWPFPAFPLFFVVLALALVSSIASWRFRKAGRSLGRDAWLTLGIVIAALLIVVAAVFATCSLTPCIP